jgi:hypothetical protein
MKRPTSAAAELAAYLGNSPDVHLGDISGLNVPPAVDGGHGPAPDYHAAFLADAVGVPLEHDEQCALFAWADAAQEEHPELALMFSIPNGGKLPYTRNAKGKVHSPQRIALVAEGMKAGVPDVCLPVARGRFHSLWIEMKRKPNKPTQEQLQWIEALRHYGHCAMVCYGATEAINAIMGYLTQEGA